jgi:hypothetical protein
MFSQISVPEMNSDHDLIYDAYKVNIFYRGYNQVNMEQLLYNIYGQNWNPIYEAFDRELQIQHFNSIIRWLLELHAPLREYVRRSEVSP